MNVNTEISLRLKERFEFYIIALIFTILGLSIQTATFDTSLISDISELIGWLLLLISGLVGLSRLEWLPVAYEMYAESARWETEVNRASEAKSSGILELPVDDEKDVKKIMSTDEILFRLGNTVNELETKIKKVNFWARIKYEIHKWCFVLGLIFLFIARSNQHLINVLKYC